MGLQPWARLGLGWLGVEQASAGAAFMLQPTIMLQHVKLPVTQPAAIAGAAAGAAAGQPEPP